MELGKWNIYVAQFWQEIFKVAVHPDEIKDWIHQRKLPSYVSIKGTSR